MVAVFLPEIINGDESRYVGRFLASQEHLPADIFLALSCSSYFHLALKQFQDEQGRRHTHIALMCDKIYNTKLSKISSLPQSRLLLQIAAPRAHYLEPRRRLTPAHLFTSLFCYSHLRHN